MGNQYNISTFKLSWQQILRIFFAVLGTLGFFLGWLIADSFRSEDVKYYLIMFYLGGGVIALFSLLDFLSGALKFPFLQIGCTLLLWLVNNIPLHYAVFMAFLAFELIAVPFHLRHIFSILKLSPGERYDFYIRQRLRIDT